jgi:hypothetical protein
LFSLFCQSLLYHSLSCHSLLYHSFTYHFLPVFCLIIVFTCYFFLLSVTSIYYFDTSVFDMSLFTVQCCYWRCVGVQCSVDNAVYQRCHYVTRRLRMQPSAFFLPPTAAARTASRCACKDELLVHIETTIATFFIIARARLLTTQCECSVL